MIYIIEFLTKLLDLFVTQSVKQEHKRQQDEHEQIASNPRDLFDDGVLNGSDSANKSTDPTISEA